MNGPELSRHVMVNVIKASRRTRAILLGVMLAVSSPALAQVPLPDLSIEDLMKLDTGQVYGASERPQPSIEAPSSISFITAKEIHAFGYRTLADILDGVRGMYVTNDRNFSFIGTRGFANPGDYNSRILLLVNGHRVNDNVFGQAEIGAEFGIDPSMFERVEIIRGPASALYGDSAFFAVVNVITKTGASLGGSSIVLEAGTLGTQRVQASLGHYFAKGLDVAISGNFERNDGVKQLYFPVFDTPATNNGVAEQLDGEGMKQFYTRLSYKGFVVTGAYGSRQRDVPTASFGTLFNEHDPREQTTDRHTLVDAEYRRSIGGTRLTFRTSFDRFTYDGIYPFAGGLDPASNLILFNNVIGTRMSFGSGVTRALRGRQTVTAGVEFIDNITQDQTVRSSNPSALLLDSARSSTQYAVYGQDEIKLGRKFIVNAGLRFDDYYAYSRVTPRLALIFLPSSTQSLKYLYGKAFRAPNSYELNPFYFGTQVDNLRPESIDTHEFVWEDYLNDWLRTSVSTYWYKADRLITVATDDSTLFGTTFVNQGEVRAKGLELEAQMRLKGDARALVSYALQSAIDQETKALLPNSPRHMFKVRISVPGPVSGLLMSVEGHYLSSRGTISGSKVTAVTTLDTTVNQQLGPRWEIFGSVFNIFNSQYADPASSQHAQDSIPQNGRTARIGLRLRFGTK